MYKASFILSIVNISISSLYLALLIIHKITKKDIET